ncbi:autotransporter-associated beta strand repeat-containing protein [Pseudomonas sp. Pseusp97]|uniref:autotransporter-associated beta strand repeat-containing protein n=1 Tax=Pseudomonas sp. Pseusp97 TaxID=3243065 RepID=UPI0039A484F2
MPLFLNDYSSATSGLTLNVNSGAQMNATLGGKVFNLTGANINLNNAGTIDPALLGYVSVLSGGAFIGSGATSTVSVANTVSGIIRGTGMRFGQNLTSIDGLAIAVNNSLAGTTTLTNDGTITSTALSSSGATLADTPVVGVYGGSQVNMTNTGTINGRVAFETSAGGNVFTNAGSITGSVSMGAGSTNTFYAITGSSVSVGDGVQTTQGLGGLIGVNLTFAPTGTIEGGAGGNNTLILQNTIGPDLGGGTAGIGTASNATYVNFNNLTLNSGTWTLLGPLVSGSTTLNGGVAQFNDNATFGSGVLWSNGGVLEASNAGLSLANQINLGAGGLTLQGVNGMSLNGVISGSGGLTKIGSGQINLNGNNTYSGNTVLNGGVVQVGNNQAFGIGGVTVGGSSSISATSPVSLNNTMTLNSTLTATGTGALTLGGVISGGSNLIKTGSSTLTLTGNNTYTGSTSLNAGTLVVGSNTALGTGVLNAGNNTTLNASTATSLANNVNLGGNLTIAGSNALTLAGVVSGVGGLTKSGPADLILNGANTYFGNTALNVGKLIVGSNSALGSGALNAAAGTTLDTNRAVSLGNQVNLAGAMNIGGNADLTLTGTVAGAGRLVKNGAANLYLNGANAYIGGTTLNAGTLTLGNSSALGFGALTVGGAATLDSSSGLVSVGNAVVLNAALSVGGTQDLTLGGVLTGIGQLVKNGASKLTLNGVNTYSGGTTLNAGTLTMGNAGALGTSALTVGGAATLENTSPLSLANDITLNADLALAGSNNLTLNGVISGAANLTKNGLSDLTLSGNNTFSGALNIASGSVTTLSSGALGNTSGANIGAGAILNLGSSASLRGLSGSGDVLIGAGNTLTLGGQSTSSTFDGALGGIGGLNKVGTGTLSLTGTNGLTGITTVSGGTLNLSGSLASAQVNVNSGASLTGSGSILGNLNVNDGGHLALSWGNTLSAASLTLGTNSNLDANLATPSTTSLMNIGGNLTLDGNLNVTDAGGFGVGVYRMFTYTGALTDNGLTVSSVPVGYGLGDILVQTLGNQVNLVVSAPNTNLRFWDGSQAIVNGNVDGGTGTWNAGGTNWTNSNGTINQTWADDFAVFQGTAGTVSVNGTQLFTGMQFLTDGYNVVNGSSGLLTAVNGTGGTTAMRVDPGVTATVGVNINGSGILNKLDAGTLVLNGANSYTGGTQLDGGTLVVGSNTALGTGALIANAGTRLDSNTAVTLANAATLNGNLTVLGRNALTLNGVIFGTGGLIKNGSASLTLGGNNAFLGPVALNAGGLVLASNSALGSATLNAANGTTLDASGAFTAGNAINLAGNLGIVGSNDLTLSGAINGVGSLTKNGAANLILSRANNFLGGITLDAGTLTAGSNGALGLGNLTVAGASSLDSNTSVSLGNNVLLNATLTNVGTHNLTLGGVLVGNGALIKNSAANLTLNGSNTFRGGTTLKAGTLTLGSSTALGNGALTVAGDATLDTSAPLNLANDINANANLGVAGSNNLTLSGVLSGAGTLTKNGTADLTLTGNNTFSGTFNVQSGSLTTLGNTALGSNAGVNLGNAATLNLGGSGSLASLTGSGTALVGFGKTLSIGSNNASSLFDGVLTGSGELSKLGTGTLTLTGINSLTGNATVNAGTLNVSGSLDSASVLVNSGGTLAGSGSLGGAVTVADGGHLAGATGSTLLVNSLAFNANSNFDIGLGAPTSGSGNALVSVGGNLTLDGTLNVSDIGGFGNGVYRLFDYAGSLIDNGMLLGSLPGGATPGDLALQTALANRVNLLVSMPGTTVQFWDGSQLAANGSVDGGSGTWGTGTSNWTDVNGTTNQAWANSFAVFQGTAGTVTINGTQTANGMQFVTDGYRLQGGTAGALSLVNGSLGNAAIRVDPNATATIDVELTGTASLGKYDSGTLVLNGANSYTGGTALNGGTLVLGNAGALGSGGLTAANGTTLDTSAALALGNAVVLDGGLALAGSHDLTLNGDVSGNGSLTKNGSGTLALNGANTYSGGTRLNGGTLLLGNAGALGSGSLNAAGGTTLDSSAALTLGNAITLAGELTLAGSNELGLAGVISGTGSLTKQGASNLTLSGDNSFSGALNILGGSLILNGNNALGNASLNVSDIATASVGGTTVLGALSGNGTITLASGSELQVGSNNANSVYEGSLNGPGSLSKTGTGKLVLNGRSSVAGGTLVNAGSLIIGGAAGSTASLASDVQVANGALLGGHGNIIGRVDLASGATLNPGNSIGTLHVDGNVNLAVGSNLEIEANPDGSSDRLISTGAVNLNGANLKVLAGAGDWAPSTSYGIIQAASLNGTFTGVSSNLAFLTPELAYSATGVELTLERNDVSFISAGRSYNQRSAAAGVESLATGTLYNAISVLTVEQAQAAYDSLSGELHASTQGALFDDSRYVRDAIGQRLRAAQGQASTDAILHTDADSGMTFWLQGYGGWGDTSGNSNTARLDHDSRGTLLGIDLPVGDNWRVGVAAGYGTSKLDLDARSSSAEIDSTSLTLFASGQWDALNLRVGASHAWNDIDSSRHVQVGSLAEHDKASYDANTTQVFGELGYAIAAGDFTLEPFAGLAHVKVDSDSFKEHGGSTALRGNSEEDDVTYGTLGLHASTALTTVGSVPLALQGALGWQHAFDDLDPKRQLSFAGGDAFTVTGTPLAQDTALAQLGVTAQVASGTTVDLGYSGQFGDGYKDNGIRLGLNVSF